MEALSTEKFAKNPITIKGKKLTVHLDALNEALEPYKLRVDALDDIFMDKDFPDGNVLKLLTTYTGGEGGGWDDEVASWFFTETKEMEDKFEASSDVVSAAEFDRGNKVLTLSLNKKNVELVKTYEKGGNFSDGDTKIAQEVESHLQNSPAEIFGMLGIDMPESHEKMTAMLNDVKGKAIAHIKGQRPKSVMIFFQGKKIDLGLGASTEGLYLQQAFYDKFYDFAVNQLAGNQNDQYAQEYASNKAIIAMDMIKGMAVHKAEPVFYVDESVVDDVVGNITAVNHSK